MISSVRLIAENEQLDSFSLHVVVDFGENKWIPGNFEGNGRFNDCPVISWWSMSLSSRSCSFKLWSFVCWDIVCLSKKNLPQRIKELTFHLSRRINCCCFFCILYSFYSPDNRCLMQINLRLQELYGKRASSIWFSKKDPVSLRENLSITIIYDASRQNDWDIKRFLIHDFTWLNELNCVPNRWTVF